MEQERFQRELLRRLDVLIALQLEQDRPTKSVPVFGKVRWLTELGLAPSEVASIIGKPTSYVTAVLAQQRKKRPKKELPEGE